MAGALDSLEYLIDEYKEISDSVAEQISKLNGSSDKGQNQIIMEQISHDMKECKQHLDKMKTSLLKMSRKNRLKWQSDIEKHYSGYKRLKNDFEAAQKKSQRNELFGAKNGSLLNPNAREKLAQIGATETQTTEILKDTLHQMHGIEDQAVEIESKLAEDRSKIKNITKNTKEGNDLLDKMDGMARRMQRREKFLFGW